MCLCVFVVQPQMNFLFYVPQMATYGGMERHVCSLAIAAAKSGHRIRILTTSNSLGPELRTELAIPGIELRELTRARGAAGKLTKLLWLFRESAKARGTRSDLIYTNGQSTLARTVWHAARRGTRIVHHHHTAADAGEQATWAKGFVTVLRRAPELVGCSEATCAALNQAVGRTDARFLPYLTRCPVTADQVSTRAPHAPLRFGFTGRLIPEKGINVIIRLSAERALADIEWHVHGAGPAYPPEFFASQPRVVYHGAYRSLDEHSAALVALDALALFSTHNEGMPLSLIEGMSAGLPLIATDRGGTRELAHSTADTVIVAADLDFQALVNRVRQLADAIKAGSTSRKRQRAIYDRYYAPEVVARRWLDYFTQRPLQTGLTRSREAAQNT